MASNSSDDGDAPPGSAATAADSPLQFSSKVQATGPGESADQAIADTLKGMQGTAITSAEMVPAPPDSGGTGQWLRIHFTGTQQFDVQRQWLAQLVHGAVADRMRTDQQATADVLGGAQLVNDSGDQNGNESLGHGGVLGGQLFGSPSDEELRSQVETSAAKLGLKVNSVEVLHPLESALMVNLTVPDGEIQGWNAQSLEHAIEGAVSPDFNPDVEGVYIELESPSGKPVLKESYAYRVPEGGLWVDPDQEDRFGVNHG
jgi:hypothetical protein